MMKAASPATVPGSVTYVSDRGNPRMFVALGPAVYFWLGHDAELFWVRYIEVPSGWTKS